MCFTLTILVREGCFFTTKWRTKFLVWHRVGRKARKSGVSSAKNYWSWWNINNYTHFTFFADVQSVIIRSSSTKNCWSPQASSNPCAPVEGTLLSLQSYCQGEGVMLTLRQDDTIVHSCSGKCVYLNQQGFLALENEPCDKFTKRNDRSGTFALSHVASGSCLNVDVSKRLKLGSCKTPHMFEVTTSGIKSYFRLCIAVE